MKKKSILALALSVLLLLTLFASCKPAPASGEAAASAPAAAAESQAPASSAPPAAPEAPPESAAPADPAKDKIVIGGVRSQTGVFAVFDETAFGPIYRLWEKSVNAEGGIYVEEYGKKLPVEIKIYDDASDLGTMTRYYEKLILEDKVDFLIPPVSTAFLNAMAPIADRYGYNVIGAEGGSTTLKESIAKYPGFFSTLNFSDTQIPALIDVLKEGNVTSAYIVYIEDLHGIEYSEAAAAAFPGAGIEIRGTKSVPPDIQDMTTIINDAKASGAQAFLVFAYPDQGFLAVGQSMALAYNPEVYLIGPGGNFEFVKGVFGGDAAVEGLMSWGGWNTKSSPKAAEFAARFLEEYKDAPEVSIDWWGHLPYYTGLEVLAQAIEKAGSLDNAKVRDVIRTEHFDPVMGDVWFENNLLANDCYLGNVGQWQNGIFEVIDVSGHRTAAPVFPKPNWP
jgi:branched-chain amino acid transport system substrate-binding protein